VRKRYSRAAFLRGVKVRLRCEQPATVRLRLLVRVKRSRGRLVTARAGDLVLAERSTSVSGTRKSRLRPAKRLARRLPKGKGLRVRLVAEARDEFGIGATVTRTAKVRKVPSRKR
jgi:hypothetical protein